MASVTSTRITHGTFIEDGSTSTKQDNWTCKSSCYIDVGKFWIGKTMCIPKVNEVHDANRPSRNYGDETGAQLLTRKFQEIMRQYPVRKEESLQAILNSQPKPSGSSVASGLNYPSAKADDLLG